jgi:hypothetical protein
VIVSNPPSSFILIWRKEITYFAVSLPVFARFSSCDFFCPSNTTLRGVIRRFPCAIATEEQIIKNKISKEMNEKEEKPFPKG